MFPSRFTVFLRAFAAAMISLALAGSSFAQCGESSEPREPVDSTLTANTPITYKWTTPVSASSVQGYSVFLIGDRSNTEACSSSRSDSSCTQTSGLPAGTYRWFVRTNYTACVGGVDSRESGSFTVKAGECTEPSRPALNTPADGASLSSTPTLTWNPVGGVAKYDVYLGTSNPPTTPIATVTTASFTPPPTLANGKYFWFVKAIASCDDRLSSSSEVRAFILDRCPSAPILLPPTSTGFVAPGNISLRWTSPAGATSYDVHIGLDGKTPSREANVVENGYTLNVSTSGHSVDWYVIANAAGCNSAESAHGKFSVCNQQQPVANSPTDNATFTPGATGSASVNFSWTAVSGAIGYDVDVASDANNFHPVASTTGDTATTASANFSAGTYTWFIRAKMGTACPVQDTNKRVFTVAAVVCPDPPVLIAPSNGASISAGSITLSWNPVAGATQYVVSAAINGEAARVVAATTSTSATSTLAGGLTVEWFVAAKVPSCPDRESSHFRFTTLSCPSAAPAITAPANGSTFTDSDRVTFTWSSVAGAGSYDVFIFDGDGTTTIQKTTVGSTTTSTSFALAAGSYVGVVRVNADGCNSFNSQAVRFTVKSAVTCPSTKPSLVSPANDSKVTLPVTFDWDDVDKATGYNLYAVTPGTTNSSTLIGSTTKSQFTATSLPSGITSWFVQALFDNCPATESARFNINVSSASNCPTTAPTLVSPANGASDVKSPVDFDWSDVAGDVKYRLLVSFNGSTATTIALIDESKFSATIPSGSYEWYVEVISGTSCPAIASQHFRFTVPVTATCGTASPALTSPADGTTGLTSPVTLQWSAVANAVSYKVFAASGNSTTLLVGQTSSTTLSVPFPAGTVSWFVEAIFSGDCASTVSKRASFTVSAGTTCKNSPAALKLPANGASDIKSPVTFEWEKVDGAVGYKLFVSTNGSGFDLAGSTTETKLERIIPAGSISWYVVTVFSGCDDQQSSTFRFTIPSAICPTGIITLNSPANGASVTSPIAFSWSAITGADTYRLWVAANNEPFAIVARVAATTATISVPSGSGEWYVEALFTSPTTNTCPSISSAHSRFTVQQKTTCDTNKPPTLISPTGSTTSAAIDFKWNAAPNAVAYRVWVASANQPFADLGITKETSLTRELTAGIYNWFVEAFFEGCPTLASDRATFTIASATPRCTSDAPSIISPADNATNVSSPVTFLWSSVAGAESYRVYASIDGGATILVGETGDTSLTKALLPGTIRWLVEANFKGCSSTKSATARFTIPKAQTCSGDAAVLVAPPNNSNVTTPEVDLTWNAVSGAGGYVIWARHNDGAATAVSETTDTHKALRAPEGKIEWWVVTFVAGCPATESAHFVFNVPPPPCDNKNPLLQSPRDNASVTQPVTFDWTAVPNATGYRVFVALENEGASLVDTTTQTQSKPIQLPTGNAHWFVEATFNNCSPTRSGIGDFKVIKAPVCGTPAKPAVTLAGQVVSDTIYALRWSPVPNADKFEIQESTALDFGVSETFVVSGTALPFNHTTGDKPIQYLYRVRAISSCNDERGAYSDVISIFILPPKPVSNQQNANAEVGASGKIVQKLFLPGTEIPTTFSARGDKPWITVEPSQGTIGKDGVTLTVTSDAAFLNLGTNTGTIFVTYGATTNSNGATTLVTAVNLPVSVSLVTPVAPGGKNTPPPDSLIIPAVGHASGLGSSLFESDVRLTNVSAQTQKYLLNFTPAGTNGTVSGSSTNIEVVPGATLALDDILSNFFGLAATGGSAVGSLEIRPLTSSAASAFATTPSTSALGTSLTTAVSSRTYNSTTTGTYGQFIPAVPFAQFIGKSADSSLKTVLSLQQIAQSAAYRTNVGLVEASGEPATLLLSVYDPRGAKIAEIPESLQAGEFKQLDGFLAKNNITLGDGRIEVEVTSSTGRVTAYASVLDNTTSDPLLVSPVLKSSVSSNRFVLAGIGDFDIGIAHWKSDVRIFNASNTAADATISYYAQGNAANPRTTTIKVNAGEVKAIDDFIKTLFPSSNTAGSVIVSTPTASSLIVSGRTYTDTGKGTYGQFIPAVTPNDSTSLGGRTLQLLQLEASSRFRTNIGVAETSGNPVTVEISIIQPDSRVTPKIPITLAANEFRQIGLNDFGLSNVYNVRATVKVLSGTGKVTAYGSVIDQTTQDPTYVPAQ